MTNKSLAFLTLIMVMAMAGRPYAMEPLVESFDKNPPKFQLDKEELANLLKHRFVKFGFADIDINNDGVIDNKELESVNALSEQLIANKLREIQEIYGDREYYSIEQIKEYLKDSKQFMSNFLVRNSYKCISFDQDFGERTNLVDGATFSFSRDFLNNNNSWAAKGALLFHARAWTIGKTDKPNDNLWHRHFGHLNAVNLIPSISLDRQATSNSNKNEVDKLVMRFGGEAEVMGGWLDSQYWRLMVVHGTDTGLKSAIEQIEMEWEPVKLFYGIHMAQYTPRGFLGYKLRIFAHGEYGWVSHAGDNSNLEDDSAFLRVGPDVRLELFLADGLAKLGLPKGLVKELKKLKYSADWYYRWAAFGDPHTSGMIAHALSYQLDQAGHLKLSVAYRHGDVEVTQEKVDSLTLGLTYGF